MLEKSFSPVKKTLKNHFKAWKNIFFSRFCIGVSPRSIVRTIGLGKNHKHKRCCVKTHLRDNKLILTDTDIPTAIMLNWVEIVMGNAEMAKRWPERFMDPPIFRVTLFKIKNKIDGRLFYLVAKLSFSRFCIFLELL